MKNKVLIYLSLMLMAAITATYLMSPNTLLVTKINKDKINYIKSTLEANGIKYIFSNNSVFVSRVNFKKAQNLFFANN